MSGTVSKSVVPDFISEKRSAEKGGTFLLAVCEDKRAEIDGVLVGKGNIF